MTDSTDNARGPERIWLEPEAPHDCYGEIGRTWCDTPDEWDVYDGNHPVEYIRADLVPDPLGAGKVRALVWQDRTDILGLHDAESPIGWWYNITETPEGLFQYEGDPALENPGPLLRFHTLEEAKAAAQADYEARIRSALEPCDPLEDPRVVALRDALTEAAKQHRIIAGMGLMSASSVAYNAAREAEAALAALSPTGGNADG